MRGHVGKSRCCCSILGFHSFCFHSDCVSSHPCSTPIPRRRALLETSGVVLDHRPALCASHGYIFVEGTVRGQRGLLSCAWFGQKLALSSLSKCHGKMRSNSRLLAKFTLTMIDRRARRDPHSQVFPRSMLRGGRAPFLILPWATAWHRQAPT